MVEPPCAKVGELVAKASVKVMIYKGPAGFETLPPAIRAGFGNGKVDVACWYVMLALKVEDCFEWGCDLGRKPFG